MKIPKKVAPLFRSFLMALILPFVMIFFITLINVGLKDGFVLIWMKNYAIAFVIALPLIILLAPRIHKFVEKISE